MNNTPQLLSAASTPRRRRSAPFRSMALSLFNERGFACRWTRAGLGYVHGSVRKSPWRGLFDESPIQEIFPNPVGNLTSWTYDSMGRVLTETNEKNAVRSYEYDDSGRLIETTDRNGRVVQYEYDYLGRQTAEKWIGANDAVIGSIQYAFDANNNLLSVTDTISGANYAFTYDALNRSISESSSYSGHEYTFNYEYNAIGQKTQSALTIDSVPDRVIDYVFDGLGRMESMMEHGLTDSNIAQKIVEFDYDAYQLSSLTRYAGAKAPNNKVAATDYLYNQAGMIIAISHKKNDNSSFANHSYTYNSVGHITQYTNSIDGAIAYSYDYTGQLTGADYSNLAIADELYTYDANGNRVLANGDTYVTGANNELTADGAYVYTYDAEGNRISKTNADSTQRELYEWDYRNRLTSVTKQTFNAETETWTTTQIVEYAYDYNNVWLRKTLDANGDGTSDSRSIFISENGKAVIQIDNDLTGVRGDTISHRYLWLPSSSDKFVCDEQASDSGSTVIWGFWDMLGSLRDWATYNSASGLTLAAHIIYDAYGNVLSCKDGAGAAVETPVLFGYTGKAFDKDTQLQNNVNRWYDALIGRWLSTDPIGFNGGDGNLYRYVSNVVNWFLDSLGLQSYQLFGPPTKPEPVIGVGVPKLPGSRLEFTPPNLGEILNPIQGIINEAPTWDDFLKYYNQNNSFTESMQQFKNSWQTIINKEVEEVKKLPSEALDQCLPECTFVSLLGITEMEYNSEKATISHSFQSQFLLFNLYGQQNYSNGDNWYKLRGAFPGSGVQVGGGIEDGRFTEGYIIGEGNGFGYGFGYKDGNPNGQVTIGDSLQFQFMNNTALIRLLSFENTTIEASYNKLTETFRTSFKTCHNTDDSSFILQGDLVQSRNETTGNASAKLIRSFKNINIFIETSGSTNFKGANFIILESGIVIPLERPINKNYNNSYRTH